MPRAAASRTSGSSIAATGARAASLEETAGGRGAVAFLRDGERRWVLRHYRRGGLVARVLDDTYL